MKQFGFIIFGVILLLVTLPEAAFAASLSNAKNTISTSRPSPSTPLSQNAAAAANQISVHDNKSRFLSGDAAILIRNTSLIDNTITVSSQSAALTTVYISDAGGLTTAGQSGTDVLFTPITAMHTIQFTTVNAVPTNGDIVITFPTLTSGDSDNDASPSATTFQFNNVVSGTGGRDVIEVWDDSSEITASVTITETEPSPGNPGIISLNVDSGSITAGSVVKIYLGCTASTSASCTTQAPRILNPTKTATAGTADSWKINLKTEDASDLTLDESTINIGTIDSVQVRATVDPTLSFSINPVNNGLAANTNNTTGCNDSTDVTNTGIDATSTVINLGVLGSTPTGTSTQLPNLSAQYITISTNADNGYLLTATSSGSLSSSQTGFTFNSTTTPTAFPSGVDNFGLNACGLDVPSGTWGASTFNGCDSYITGGADACLYAWPTATTSITLAQDTSGPVGNVITTGNGITTVKYAAGTDVTVPAGEYTTAITYVATPTF